MSSPSRRRFLRVLTVTASASALGLVGCRGSSNSSRNNTQPPPAPILIIDETRYPQGIASGDPRPNAVLLWTRVAGLSGDGSLRLQVSSDTSFAQLLVNSDFPVRAADDHCIKVRVLGLQPGQRYFYRFLLADGNRLLASPTGRTRTARALNDATPVRFAFISCQDYIGRYYNALMPLLQQDLDFVIHLGDAIYETTGDPRFQATTSDRRVQFREPNQALRLGSGENTFLAARTLSNYRDLHRTYRSDAVLKQLYAQFPVVAIWDDHEFADDSWRSNASHFNSRRDERDDERRRDAEQAYFEYMPVDLDPGGAQAVVQVDRSRLFPNTVLYRKLRFGRDVELFLTDYRSYRPDHLIPEDAFPGSVVMDREALTQLLALRGIPYAAVRNNFSPYIDIDSAQFAAYKPVLTAVATLGYVNEGIEIQQATLRAQNAIRGKLATTVVNSLLQQYNAQVPPAQRVPLLPQALIDTLDTGVAWFTMGKTSLFGEVGSRYFVVKDVYDLYAGWKLLTQDSSSQDALGPAQTQWLLSQVNASTARWKVIATSVSFIPMVLDLTPPALGVPAPLNQKFYLNVDQWDGFPQQRDALLRQALGNTPGVVFLSGDIHASFAGEHAGATVKHAEFTTPAVSSGTLRALLQSAAAENPLLASVAGALIPSLEPLLRAANPNIAYTQSNRHGVSVAEVSADSFNVQMIEFAADRVLRSEYAAARAADRVTNLRWNGSQLQVTTAQDDAAPESERITMVREADIKESSLV